jgi:hypothetical protein
MNPRVGAGLCVAFLLFFAIVGYGAVLTKSATFDEPVQTVAAWLRHYDGDFRLNIEDPPLWEEWAALPNGPDALKPDLAGPDWRTLLDIPARQWRFVTQTLWRTPGIDGATVVNRSRAMMVLIGLALGGLIALWSWRLGGPAAAVVATAVYAFDPNFLAHAPLVKNDVAATLVLLGIGFLTWRLGQRATLPILLLLAATCGAALDIKFSCVLIGPILVALLILRALLPGNWETAWGQVNTRSGRLLLAGATLAMAGVVSFGAVWAGYRFRFEPTRDPGLHINTDWVMNHLRGAQNAASDLATGAVHANVVWKPDLTTRVSLWALRHHLLPEAWLNGFLFTYATAVLRRSFLFGQMSSIGFFYYFPAAILVKTPVGSLVLFFLALGAGIFLMLKQSGHFERTWAAVCVLVPPSIYLATALRTHMNIGIRHVLPLYGFACVATGVVASQAIQRWRRPAIAITVGALIGTVIETAAAAPNFIPFFNAAAGGSRNGVDLLGDSNLDWGQDLPLLAAWQKAHQDTPLYLSYFGMADPAFYGIRYQPLPGNYVFGPSPDGRPIQSPAVLAISANHLQGISVGTKVGDRYRALRQRAPLAVLGGSIYLFDVPDAAAARELSVVAAQ